MNFVREHRLEDRVTFLGMRRREEVRQFVGIADTFVLSSAYEGMPIAVLEALGCGVPVVATRVGEIDLIVEPGTNGYIVEPGDPAELATAILNCLARCWEMRGPACVDSVQRFTPDRVLSALYETYRMEAS